MEDELSKTGTVVYEDTSSKMRPRKRRSKSKSTSDDDPEGPQETPRRKKHKNRSSNEEKENNGQPTKSTNSRRWKSTDLDDRNDSINRFQGRNAINAPDKPPEAGVITKIYIENFMCHQKLTVELNRNINFIYGQNGSGKSAILAAIQICLGANARRTNRARNLKGMVRKNTTSNCARLRVTLLNKGDDSYKHDVYGDHITVERTIALRGGYHGYKLLDEDGKEQSRSKKELDEMLDKLNIQVDNPVAILDQEEAKKFLTGKNSDKYKFFMKATEIERLDNTYASTLEKIEEMDSQADRLHNAMESDKELVNKARKAYKQYSAIAKFEIDKNKLSLQANWSQYKMEKLELEQKQQTLEKMRSKAEKKKNELSRLTQESQEAESPRDERRERLEELTSEGNEMAERKKELEQELKKLQAPQKSLSRQFKEIQKFEKEETKNLLQANKRLENKRDEILKKAGSAEAEQAKRNERRKAAAEKLSEGKARISELKQSVTDAFNKFEELEESVVGAKRSVSEHDIQLRAIDSRIRKMESSSGNPLDAFGPRCNKVKQLVEKTSKQGKFRGPVLGPIGFYCKVVPGKEKLATLLDTAIGNGVLDRFVVYNDEDRKLFQKIRREAGCDRDCGVFQQHHHRGRFSTPPPPQGVETISTILTIDNDLIFNCLVDFAKIETKALFHDLVESEKSLLVNDNRGRDAIRGGKIREVYFFPKGDHWKVLGRQGHKQMVSGGKPILKNVIGVDKTAAIEEAKKEYAAVEVERRQVNADYNKLEHDHTALKKAWNAHKKELQKIQKETDRADKTIAEINNEEIVSLEMNIDTSLEESDVSESQDRLEELKRKKEEIQEKIKETLPIVTSKKADLEEITERNKKITADINSAEEEFIQHSQLLTQQKEKQEKIKNRIDQYEELINVHTEEIEKKEKEVFELKRNAQRFQLKTDSFIKRRKEREDGEGTRELESAAQDQHLTEEDLERVGVPDNLDDFKALEYYLRKIENCDRNIEKEKKRRLENDDDDEDAAYDKYVRAKEVYNAKANQLEEIESCIEKMDRDIKIRQGRLQEFRNYACFHTNTKFDEMLNIKGSSGTVGFDHENGELNLNVQKDSFDEKSQQRDVKALSGGEKSFTTIALLLALGEMLETPFRVMDEFDVFLDPVTRKLIIDTLIEVGMAMEHRQFIFITPQDISNVDASQMVKILKMKPPERLQVAGAPTQTTLDFSQT